MSGEFFSPWKQRWKSFLSSSHLVITNFASWEVLWSNMLSPAGSTQNKRVFSYRKGSQDPCSQFTDDKVESQRGGQDLLRLHQAWWKTTRPVSWILVYRCFLSLLGHISCIKAFAITLNGRSSSWLSIPSPKCGPHLSSIQLIPPNQRQNNVHSPSFKLWLAHELFWSLTEPFCHVEQIQMPFRSCKSTLEYVFLVPVGLPSERGTIKNQNTAFLEVGETYEKMHAGSAFCNAGSSASLS